MKTRAPDLAVRIAELFYLNDNPAVFCERRREILNEFISTFSQKQQKRMHQFQEQIDNSNAVAGSPSHAVKKLFEMIDERANAIDEARSSVKSLIQIGPRT